MVRRKDSKFTVRDAIVTILVEDFPLSTNKLKNELALRFNTRVSYQAVHKELAHLEEGGCITREGKECSLNVDWIRSKREFFQRAEINYTKLKKYSLSIIRKVHRDGELARLEFESISEMDDYFVNVMTYFHDITPKDALIIMHYRHNWWPIIYAKKEEEILQADPANARFYCLCGSDTPLDRWATTYENAIGMNVRVQKGTAENWNVHVYGDVLIQFNLDPEIGRRIDAFFEKNKSIESYNPKELLDVLSAKAKHTVLIYKDHALAERIRDETTKAFKKK